MSEDNDQWSSSNLFEFLDKVEKRPGMYVGGETARTRLDSLEDLIHGYETALAVHGITEQGTDFIRDFADYLRSEFGWSMSCGPIAAIRVACNDDDIAWTRFWTLLREYRTRRFGSPS
jgi:hypothetical protein